MCSAVSPRAPAQKEEVWASACRESGTRVMQVPMAPGADPGGERCPGLCSFLTSLVRLAGLVLEQLVESLDIILFGS